MIKRSAFGYERTLESRLQATHNAEKDRLQKEHDVEKEGLHSRISELQKVLESETRHWHAKISQMQQEHKSEKDRMQEEHESEREHLIAQMRQEHKSEKDRMQKKHDFIIGQMSQEHESKRERLIAEMKQEHESEKDRMQEEHKSEKNRMQEEYDSIIGRMSQEHSSNQARLVAKMVEMKQEHDSEQEQMRKDVEAWKMQLERQKSEEEARLKSEFEIMKARLEGAHAKETKRLRRDIEAYNEELLTRDDFKPMPDGEMGGRFLDLAQEIDTLARLEWKPNQKDWTDQVRLRLATNQRLLKKQILQDIIWVIFHENIFCSPFRIFGEEDSHLDNGSYIWPEPSIDAERWRYATIKECRAALEQAASEWDPRARIRKSFKTSLDALKQELTSTLGEISDLDKSSIRAAESIVMKAIKIWLEFGMQRCRILVIMQGSNLKSAEERIQRAQEATLKLVAVPELKRFGNLKGQDMYIEETVWGCDGEMTEVSITQ